MSDERWEMRQCEKWPFYISVHDANGHLVIGDDPHYLSSNDKTPEDTLTARNWDADHQEEARACNARQMEQFRLIAACPDLYAALVEMVEEFRDPALMGPIHPVGSKQDRQRQAIEHARAALAKAKPQPKGE